MASGSLSLAFNEYMERNCADNGDCDAGHWPQRLVQEARCRYFWVLNPDVVVPAGYYREMLGRADSDFGHNLFGSTITFGDRPDTIWFAGGDVDLANGGFSIHRFIGKNISDVPSEAYECDYLTGANVFGRTSVLDRIGYLPEDYFLYYEETDWFMRAREYGERPLLFPDMHLAHWKRSEVGGLPTKTYFYYLVRNAYLFGDRYAKGSLAAREAKLADFRESWLKVIREKAPEREAEFERLFERATKDGMCGVSGRVAL